LSRVGLEIHLPDGLSRLPEGVNRYPKFVPVFRSKGAPRCPRGCRQSPSPKWLLAIAREFQEFSADKLYWNTISGSPFYMVAQPWMKGYVDNAEFEVHYERVWLDK